MTERIYRKGGVITKIAKILGCSRQSVYAALDKYGEHTIFLVLNYINEKELAVRFFQAHLREEKKVYKYEWPKHIAPGDIRALVGEALTAQKNGTLHIAGCSGGDIA